MKARDPMLRLLAGAVAGPLLCAPCNANVGGTDVSVRTITGLNPGDSLGASVAALGDVNGDGVDDIAVGAPFADDPASAAGAVRIYLGGSGFFSSEPQADGVLKGELQDDQFGNAIAGGFDLNGDGYNDLAVAARFSDRADTDAGAVFIFFGGPTPLAGEPLVLLGEATDDWFGQSVCRAGDVNNDGFDDLIVGAPFNDAAASAAGRAYIYLGGDPMDAAPDAVLDGPSASDSHFGWSVGGGGDINNDGFDDVIVGARLFGAGLSRARGRAYVYFGGGSMDTTPDAVLNGEARDDWFGSAVSVLGDVNMDGFDDVAVGAIFNDSAALNAGEATIFFGGDPFDDVGDVFFAIADPDAQLGNALAGCDLDADGVADAVIAAHFADDGLALAAGRVFVLLGGAAFDASADIMLIGEGADDHLGESIEGVAALEPATLPAMLAGAHFNDAAGNGAGRAYAVRVSTCPADFNGDSIVDGADLATLLAAWETSMRSRDLNGDGVVDGADLAALLANWGVCP